MFLQQRFIRMLFNAGLVAPVPQTDVAKELKKADKTGFIIVDAMPDNFVTGEVADMVQKNNVKLAPVSGYWFGSKGPDGKYGQRAAEDEKVFYHLHGGGFFTGTGLDSASFAKVYLSYGVVKRVFGITYRKSSATPFDSTNPFPAVLLDCLSGYHYLVNTLGFKPKNIIVSGDSAGGLAAFNLARYLASQRTPSLPQTGGLLLFSPSVDWANTHDTLPNTSMIRNTKTDYVEIIFRSNYTAHALLGSLPFSELPSNSWIAPASLKIDKPQGLFKDFPSTCLITGGAECSVDPMRTLAERLTADNGKEKVEYYEYPDAPHDHLLFEFSKVHREETIGDIWQWIQKIWA